MNPVGRIADAAGWPGPGRWGRVIAIRPDVNIALTIIALLIQFAGACALFIHFRRTQK